MKVICINDKKLPEGGELVEGKEYEVEKEFINNFDQKVFVISGINNYGMTKMGMRWYGYDSKRFADAEKTYERIEEYNSMLI
jgi:hypothetical protein